MNAYDKVAKWRKENPLRHNAHKIVERAVKSGRIKRGPCAMGGEENTQGHHEDYSHPRRIMWLCKKHHRIADIARRNGYKLPPHLERIDIPVVHRPRKERLQTLQAGSKMNGMRKIVEFLKEDPKREYSLSQIASKRLMPWARNGRTIRDIIERDRLSLNILHAKIKGRLSQRRYVVTGESLMNYLITYGPALMRSVRKNNQNHGKQKRRVPGSTARTRKAGRNNSSRRTKKAR